ncbi:MAG: hypothetical protein IH993_01035 [Proteobacteria bacterium]|nr:hypothetical protein [Pseudomonadota bacterium]
MATWIETIVSSPWFVLASGLASILALAITMYVAWRIRALQRAVIVKFRLPSMVRQLDRNRSSLSDLLNDFNHNQTTIRDLLVRTKSAIQRVETKISGDERRLAKELIVEIGGYLGRDSRWRRLLRLSAEAPEGHCRRIYEMLLELTESLRHSIADAQARI